MKLRILLVLASVWFLWACYRISPAVAWTGPVRGVWLEDKTLRATITAHRNAGYTAVGFYTGQRVFESGYYIGIFDEGLVMLQHPAKHGNVQQIALARLW